jgi:hypothetical protein
MTFDSYVLICVNVLIDINCHVCRICGFTNSFCFGRINFTDTIGSRVCLYFISYLYFDSPLNYGCHNQYLCLSKGTLKHSKVLIVYSYERRFT